MEIQLKKYLLDLIEEKESDLIYQKEVKKGYLLRYSEKEFWKKEIDKLDKKINKCLKMQGKLLRL